MGRARQEGAPGVGSGARKRGGKAIAPAPVVGCNRSTILEYLTSPGGARLRRQQKSEHEFCRVLLREAMRELRKENPRRYLDLAIGSKVRIGSTPDWFVEVVDHLDPGTGHDFPSEGGAGHFRKLTYEVSACCAWTAKWEALCKHRQKFEPAE